MKEKPKDNSIRFHYCNEHDRLCIACPDCVESARKEGALNLIEEILEITLLPYQFDWLYKKREAIKKEVK